MEKKDIKNNTNFITKLKDKRLARKAARQLQKQQKLATPSKGWKPILGEKIKRFPVKGKELFTKLFYSIKHFSFLDYFKDFIHSKKKKTTVIAILVFFVFVVSVFSLLSSLTTLVAKQESKIYYIDDQGIKFLEIENGFITEKLVVESGDSLPTIQDYFSENYEIQSDATISYFDGKNGISIESFTFEKEGNVYVRGIREIDVVIQNGKEYSTKLIIKDTKDPYVTLQDLTITEGESIDPESFVSLYVDEDRKSVV